MLSPKRTKYRKMQKGNNRGLATAGSDISFGDFGLQALEPARLTSRQIEAARMAIQRHVKRAGVLYEISGVEETTAREAFRLAGHKLPMDCRFLARGIV